MQNIFQTPCEHKDGTPEGFRAGRAFVGWEAGARHLGASVYELPPGQALNPYHWHVVEEEILFVLDGSPSVRTPEGWVELGRGDVLVFPPGEEGAHQVANRSADPARVLMVSNARQSEICFYPDSGKVGVYPRRGEGALYACADAVDYYDGETPP
jgi:uncharacterized cupin superfamily protein